MNLGKTLGVFINQKSVIKNNCLQTMPPPLFFTLNTQTYRNKSVSQNNAFLFLLKWEAFGNEKKKFLINIFI